METNEQPPVSVWKAGMHFGAILGLAQILLALLFYMMGDNRSKYISWLSIIVFIAMFIWVLIKYRDQNNNGYITYGKALGTGTLICLFSALLFAFYLFVFYNYIDPASLEKILEAQRQGLADAGQSEEQVELSMQMMYMIIKPTIISILTFLILTFCGFILSLIVAAAVKKEDSSFESNFR